MDMVSEGFIGTLKKSVEEGKVSVETVNTACRRILEAKYKLGLFDNPYKYCDLKRPARDIFTKEHRAAARKIAGESFVLLKNEGLSPTLAPVPVSYTHLDVYKRQTGHTADSTPFSTCRRKGSVG